MDEIKTDSAEKVDYSGTVNLPRTDFPMKAGLPQREPERLKLWDEKDLYQTVQASRQGKPKWVLHDGPPYANNNIHIGTAMNKILKDIIVKFRTMQGFDSPYVPGFDTHGLPIERQAIQAMKIDRSKIPALDLREKCAEYARKYAGIQTEEFKRLGVRGDWEHPYLTLQPEYEAEQIRVFGEMANKGYIYRGLKSVYWCTYDETALAEAEIEYKDKTSYSIYVAFPVRDGKGLLPAAKFRGGDEGAQATSPDAGPFFVIWTTTPWTIPANTGISLHPDFDYGLYATEKGRMVLATELAPKALEAMGLTGKLERTWKGADLEGVICGHPFLDRDSRVVVGEHVTLDAGTGCVHTAPGHGVEDFEVGTRFGLPVIVPLDGRGIFTAEAGPFAGQFYAKAQAGINDLMRERGALLGEGTLEHSYAHCWRCKNPIVYRATEQWFASINGFRDQALKAIEGVEWIPAWGEDRIHNMVADRQDWCISRQRVWGVPIPVFYCKDCNEPLITAGSIEAVASLFGREGSNAWWRHDADEILPPGTHCPHCGGGHFRKETDIMDVWFDSGSSHVAVLTQRPELKWPADIYLEGSDQHRGWFNSSLSTAVATRGTAPYKAVLTHGWVLDAQGRTMHKSAGNAISPDDVTKQYGADILRLWVASSDYRSDVKLSQETMKQMAEVYRKIRNTLRYLLGNLADFDPARDAVPYRDLAEIDRWALDRLQRLVQRVTESYDHYEFWLLYHDIHNFAAVDMSSFYLDVLKDRLYTSGKNSLGRRAAQTVLYETAVTLIKLIAPVLTFTADEAWDYLCKPVQPGLGINPGEHEAWTVQATYWPEPKREYMDDALAARWERLLLVRTQVTKALEEARAAKAIGTSLEAMVELQATPELAAFLRNYLSDLPGLFIVSQVRLLEATPEASGGIAFGDAPDKLLVDVKPAEGTKCERCWTYSTAVGTHEDHPGLCDRCDAVVRQL
ncbi:MAG: isoleucine--tRNA ligase [Symbiobacteriia bacterium]